MTCRKYLRFNETNCDLKAQIHRLCNHYKRGLTLDDWRNYRLKGLVERLMKIYIFHVALNFDMIEIKEWHDEFYFETKQKPNNH
jgi:hypothetical protein